MALIAPILDNRTWEELRDELIRRIPAYTPTWTDHNPTDPGITLLELFAYLGESLLYRFNQIPETTRIEFLRLLGVQPRPARPAHVLLAAATDGAAGVQVLRDSGAAAGDLQFQTEDELFVWPLDVVGAGKTPTTAGTGESREDALERADLDGDDATFYRTTLTATDPTAPDAVPLDVTQQVDGALWVALLARDTTDVRLLAGRTLFLGVAFDETVTAPPVLQPSSAGAADRYRAGDLMSDPPPVRWQLWLGPGTDDGPSQFRTLSVVGDTTRGLTTTGVVKLELPADFPTDPLGTGLADSPPPLDDEEQAARVIGWLRGTRPASQDVADSIGRILWVGANCVSAVQARTPPAELLGTGSGDADQRFALAHSPVLPGTVSLQVEEAGRWEEWTEVENFAHSGVTDRHFTVDYTGGAVVFGRSSPPQLGERIRVLRYQFGGGSVGNVPAGAVTAFAQHPSVTVTNPLPARGGTDKADLALALDEIPAHVHRHDRAVVPEDYQALALEVAGVARAEPLMTFHPDTPEVDAAGVTTLVVLPHEDVRDPAAPQPDLRLLREVATYLNERRLVTAELYVIPPEYVRVAISVGVQVRSGYQVDAVRRWVETVVRQYLGALPPDGPDAGGWPLGRSVRAAELEAVAVQVEGVEYAVGTRLAVITPDAGVTEVEVAELRKWQLPAVAALTVAAGEPQEIGAEPGTAPPAKVPVPLPVEVC